MADELPIFSPTRTAVWDFCHLKPVLEFDGRWVTRRLTKRDLSRYVGTGFAAGLAAFKKGQMLGTAPTSQEVLNTALSVFGGEMKALQKAGVEVEPLDVAELSTTLTSGLSKVLADDPLSADKGWKVQDIETTLLDWGHARIDWGGLDPSGTLCHVDYKVKLSLKAEWYNKTVEQYRYDAQMLHYCWAYGQYRQQPVNRYYICLIVLAPCFSVCNHVYEVDPELMAAWLRSSRQKWQDMDEQAQGHRIPDMAVTHRSVYGDCPYKLACLEFKLDPTLMQTAYVQLPDRKEGSL